MRWLAVVAVVASGCALIDGLTSDGDDDDGTIGPPPGSPDASPFGSDGDPLPPGPLARDLGRGCSLALNDCPVGLECVGFQGLGSTVEGYCSPLCNLDDPFDPICTDGYPGPGQPQCIPDANMIVGLCIIDCQISMACPPDLTCERIMDPDLMNPDIFVCLGDD